MRCDTPLILLVEVATTRGTRHASVVQVLGAPHHFRRFPHKEGIFGLLQQPLPFLPGYHDTLAEANLQIQRAANNQLPSCFLPNENIMSQMALIIGLNSNGSCHIGTFTLLLSFRGEAP